MSTIRASQSSALYRRITADKCACQGRIPQRSTDSHVVGYQEIEIPEGYSLFTVTFKNLGDQAFDIQSIVPIVSEKNTIYAQKCAADGSYTTSYNYRPDKASWYNGIKALGTGVVSLKPGEALCFNNKHAGTVKLQVSGEVDLNPWSGAVGVGYSLIGNMNPVAIDIQDIVPYTCDAEPAIVADKNSVYIQKCAVDGSYTKSYNYRPDKAAWYEGIKAVARGTVMFAPGEAACLNNKCAGAIQLKFPSPVAQN